MLFTVTPASHYIINTVNVLRRFPRRYNGSY